MTRSVGQTIPAALRRHLDGTDLAGRAGFTVLLLSVSPEGWPRLAMLSPGEVVATEPRTLRVALWPESTATANLTRTGRGTLAAVVEGAGWYLLCSARREDDLELPGRRLACFRLEVDQALEDIVPYARLTGGVGYRLLEPQRVLVAWQETVAALLARG